MFPAYFEIEQDGQFRVRDISSERFTIGRSDDNQLRLDSNYVSRHHAVIAFENDRFVLRDLESLCGTFVNGVALSESVLCNRDRIYVGSPLVQLTFRLGIAPDESRTEPISNPLSPLHPIRLLLEGLRAMGSDRGLDEVLAIVVDSAIELCEGERGFIMLPNAAGELDHTVARVRGKRPLTGDRIVTSRRIPDHVFLTGITEIDKDIHESEHGPTQDISIRSTICLPLRSSRGASDRKARTIGVLYVDSSQVGIFLSQSTRAALDALADEAALAIELYRESMERLRVDHEMQAAAEVQRTLFPARCYDSGPFEIAGETMPCLEVGGDFLDYIGPADDVLVFAEADVEGKGLPAAILGAKMQGMFSAGASIIRGPAELVTHMNLALSRSPDRRRFVTMACATLDARGRLAVCCAGHNPPVIVRAGGTVEELTEGGIPLGISEWTYGEQTAQLAPGDLVILYSDGVNECVNPRGEQFGMERVIDCLRSCESFTASRVLERVFEAVSAFCAAAPRADDVTVLVVRYRGYEVGLVPL